MWLSIAKFYSKVYGWVKDTFGINIRGLGFVLRQVAEDCELSVMGKRLYFAHELSEAYARPLHGKWNEPETHQFLSYVLANLKIDFIEVGANIGEILVDVAMDPACLAVTAFEPNPEAVSVIQKNIQLNSIKNCSIVCKALGDESSIQKMSFGSHSPTASLLSPTSDFGVDVEVSTLDSEISTPSCGNHNLVLLIDVEGYELNVMRGGKSVIDNCKPLIIFEYHQETRKVFSLSELKQLLGDSYSIYRLRQDAKLDQDVEDAWNCVAVPKGTEFDSILRSQMWQS